MLENSSKRAYTDVESIDVILSNNCIYLVFLNLKSDLTVVNLNCCYVDEAT